MGLRLDVCVMSYELVNEIRDLGFMFGVAIVKLDLWIWLMHYLRKVILIWIKHDLCHMRVSEIVLVWKWVLNLGWLGTRAELK